MSRMLRIGALVAGLGLALIPASLASAHVSVSSSDAAGGATGTLDFRVPNESDAAATTEVTVELPAATPFRSVRAEAMPGWTVSLERSQLDEPVEIDGATLTEAVTSVTWTADGPGIGLDEYGVFTLRVGPFPEEGGTFAFPATQTYDDGEVVEWADPTVEGEAEPEHPAPTLTVAAGEAGTDGHGAAEAAEEHDEAAAEGSGSDSTARTLGVIGIVVGTLGTVFGLYGMTRKPQTAPVGS